MNFQASKSIDGITDLVVVAPIKRGVIDAFENVTYESRLTLVAEALHKIRVNAREHEKVVPFADTVERILSLFNFRIGIIDETTLGLDLSGADSLDLADADDDALVPKRFMFLAATFDGPLEPYLRLIWNPLGPFLDLLLCNCEGYKFATEVGFPEYLAWVRDHQVEPAIFYSTSGLTLRDQFYLDQLERRQREGDCSSRGPATDRELAELTLTDPETKARATWDPRNGDVGEAVRLSFEALKVLYRLTDYFPPEKREGAILLRAVKDLLRGLDDHVENLGKHPKFRAMFKLFGLYPNERLGPFTEQWLWFTGGGEASLPATPATPLRREEVQKGLLSPYQDDKLAIRNAAVMFFSIRDRRLAATAIELLLKPTYEDEPVAGRGMFWFHRTAQNLAFTPQGLVRMGLDQSDLAKFPREFVDGLFERAPMLGDVRDNHPRRWTFPLRRDLFNGTEDDDRPAIHSEEVDLIFQLRIAGDAASADGWQFIDYEAETRLLEARLREADLLDSFDEDVQAVANDAFSQFDSSKTLTDAGAPEDGAAGPDPDAMRAALVAAFEMADPSNDKNRSVISDIFGLFDPISVRIYILTRLRPLTGLRLLAVESASRDLDLTPRANGHPHPNRDHFGFIDGISQPDAEADENHPDHAEYGDLLIGLANSNGDSEEDLEPYRTIGGIPLTFGSFMVFRKIAQYPGRLEALKAAYRSDVHEMIVGRRQDGEALIDADPADPNNFDFDGDSKQHQCPFSAHIRLANPRDSFHGRPAPKILRRGMAYGPRYDSGDQDTVDADRGLLFIAYNSSLSEQYEVIQRWLNRGNPSDVASAANDPLTGVRHTDDGYTFRYIHRQTGEVERVHVDEPLTQVQWGIYGFVPSRSGIAAICAMARGHQSSARGTVTGTDAEEERALRKITMLLKQSDAVQRDEWKRLIEDVAVKDPAKGNELPPVWKAIRNRMDGVLRLASGIAFTGDNLPEREAEDETSQPAVIVAKWQHIEDVLSDPARFSVREQGRRTHASFGDIYVAMDPDPQDSATNRVSRYAKEAIETNRIVMEFGKKSADDVFSKAYEIAKDRLKRARDFSAAVQTGSGKQPFYKLELRRDFLTPVLGGLCHWLFDIPDADVRVPDKGYIEQGAWGVREVDPSGSQSAATGLRKPRCPADFMAPSRRSFYPRPTASIIDYGTKHGKALRNASLNLVLSRTDPKPQFTGQLSSMMADSLLTEGNPSPPEQDLLARNIIGLMEGMLPPTDGLMRGILFDWVEQNAIWTHQSRYMDAVTDRDVSLAEVEKALKQPVYTAIRKRPAPDLIYRTAMMDTKIGDVAVKKGDLVVLALGSAMQEEDGAGFKAGIWPVFGGYRKSAFQSGDAPTHACPAQPIVMAMIYGMIAALFDAGRIVIQPASLIIRISDWGENPDDRPKVAPPSGPFSPSAWTE